LTTPSKASAPNLSFRSAPAAAFFLVDRTRITASLKTELTRALEFSFSRDAIE
jgi:hypothetical protein